LLNTIFRICREWVYQKGLFDVSDVLLRVQCCLQDVGTHVATPVDSSSNSKKEMAKFDVSLFEYVNSQIDVYGDRVPPSKVFILPGGGLTAAHLQYGRAICRRAERTLVPLLREGMIDKSCLRFLNRSVSKLTRNVHRFPCYRVFVAVLTPVENLSFKGKVLFRID
uniref:Corrinoid adenosyltransferase n=1 Tax=Gongylonema pulchrum TaxID=637853 RepID=A0A183D7Y6_9BILA